MRTATRSASASSNASDSCINSVLERSRSSCITSFESFPGRVSDTTCDSCTCTQRDNGDYYRRGRGRSNQEYHESVRRTSSKGHDGDGYSSPCCLQALIARNSQLDSRCSVTDMCPSVNLLGFAAARIYAGNKILKINNGVDPFSYFCQCVSPSWITKAEVLPQRYLKTNSNVSQRFTSGEQVFRVLESESRTVTDTNRIQNHCLSACAVNLF